MEEKKKEERRSSPLVVPEGMTRSAYKKQLRRERNQARWKEKKRLKKERKRKLREEKVRGTRKRKRKSHGLTTHTNTQLKNQEKEGKKVKLSEEEIQEMEKKREENRKIRQAKHEDFLKKVSYVFRRMSERCSSILFCRYKTVNV